jgi:hypothetical protein
MLLGEFANELLESFGVIGAKDPPAMGNRFQQQQTATSKVKAVDLHVVWRQLQGN